MEDHHGLVQRALAWQGGLHALDKLCDDISEAVASDRIDAVRTAASLLLVHPTKLPKLHLAKLEYALSKALIDPDSCSAAMHLKRAEKSLGKAQGKADAVWKKYGIHDSTIQTFSEKLNERASIANGTATPESLKRPGAVDLTTPSPVAKAQSLARAKTSSPPPNKEQHDGVVVNSFYATSCVTIATWMNRLELRHHPVSGDIILYSNGVPQKCPDKPQIVSIGKFEAQQVFHSSGSPRVVVFGWCTPVSHGRICIAFEDYAGVTAFLAMLGPECTAKTVETWRLEQVSEDRTAEILPVAR